MLPKSYDDLAARISCAILGYAGLREYSHPVACLYQLLGFGIEMEELRDEIFCQLVKQVYAPAGVEETLAVWEAM